MFIAYLVPDGNIFSLYHSVPDGKNVLLIHQAPGGNKYFIDPLCPWRQKSYKRATPLGSI